MDRQPGRPCAVTGTSLGGDEDGYLAGDLPDSGAARKDHERAWPGSPSATGIVLARRP